MKVIQNEFEKEIQNITQLSSEVNENNEQKILAMMKDHVFEIIELYEKRNEHYQIETADLIVLCFELLYTEKADINTIFTKCLPRFFGKLNEIKNKKKKN